MFFYSRLYILNKITILFLTKPYLIWTTLILMDLDIVMQMNIS
jgi:hypothetical protein